MTNNIITLLILVSAMMFDSTPSCYQPLVGCVSVYLTFILLLRS